MTQYFLSKHVYVCHLPPGGILLDLRRDQYIGLNAHQYSALASVVPGLRQMNYDVRGISVSEKDINSFAAQMSGIGVLTTNSAIGKCAHVDARPPPVAPPHSEQAVADSAFSYIPPFLIALARVFIALRCRSLLYAIESYQDRKRRLPVLSGTSFDHLMQLTSVFSRLRPYFYTEKEECLFDSIVLVEFLLMHKVSVDLIFGVTSYPFQAHAWVQAGQYVLNGSADYARRFHPIMTI